jgi:hypothetical protein
MYKTSYICDCCGAEMASLPAYTLSLGTQSFCIQDQVTWHYCDNCWDKIKDRLVGRDSENVEKLKEEIDRLKEENERLQNTADWWNSIFVVLINNAIKQEKEKRSTTYTTNNDGPFTTGCCCENTSKDSLNYRQTTAPYLSLR